MELEQILIVDTFTIDDYLNTCFKFNLFHDWNTFNNDKSYKESFVRMIKGSSNPLYELTNFINWNHFDYIINSFF